MISYFKYFLFKNRRNKFIESTYKAEDPWSSALNFEAVEDFIKSFVKETNSVILDIGCGEGLYSDLLKSIARKYIGIDTSKTAIARARTRHKLNEDLTFLNIDFDQIEKNNLKADILCFNFALDYLGFQQFPLIFSRTLFEVLQSTGAREVLIFNPVYSDKNRQDLEKYIFIFQNYGYYLKSEKIYDAGEFHINGYYLVKR